MEAPGGMQHAVHARFANGVELIGYDLGRSTVSQGDTLPVRLYWRTTSKQSADSRPFLHLDSLNGTITWANLTKLHAGDKPSRVWPVGFYVVDDYRLSIPSDTPPVPAQLLAGLMDGKGNRVPILDGQDQAALGRVRVTERVPTNPSTLPGNDAIYRFGSSVRLVGHEVITVPGEPRRLQVTLYWQPTAPVLQDYSVFLHVRDADGSLLAQGDGPPVNGLFPSQGWLPGEVITDRHEVELPDAGRAHGATIAIGLYTLSDGVRAEAWDAAGVQRLPDDQVLLAGQP